MMQNLHKHLGKALQDNSRTKSIGGSWSKVAPLKGLLQNVQWLLIGAVLDNVLNRLTRGAQKPRFSKNKTLLGYLARLKQQKVSLSNFVTLRDSNTMCTFLEMQNINKAFRCISGLFLMCRQVYHTIISVQFFIHVLLQV